MRKKNFKGEFQYVFEFVNKVALPRSEKRTIASILGLYVIECLSKFELISLAALMIQHIHKVIYDKEGRHALPYEYFLNKVFDHFRVVCDKITSRIVKKCSA